jgi:excisionase family DNA binding protein
VERQALPAIKTDPCRWRKGAPSRSLQHTRPIGAREQKVLDRLSQTPSRPHLPRVRGQFRHVRPDALAITEDDMDKLLLTPTEAATALGIGRSKVYELMQTGQLQSVHIGACRRIPADALTAFLDRLRTAS